MYKLLNEICTPAVIRCALRFSLIPPAVPAALEKTAAGGRNAEPDSGGNGAGDYVLGAQRKIRGSCHK